MKFISRRVRRDLVGIVDSVTGKEVVTHIRRIDEPELNGRFAKPLKDGSMSERFEPWQSEGSRTPLQVKTLVLTGVDVRVHQSMVTAIVWGMQDMTHSVRIRPSDYGTCLGDCLISKRDGNLNGHTLTVVLDDKVLPVNQDTFRLGYDLDLNVFDHLEGVVVDLTEVSSDGDAELVYWSLAHEYYHSLRNMVIDRAARKSRFLSDIANAEFNDPYFEKRFRGAVHK